MANRSRRILKEMEDLRKDELSGMSAELVGDDISHLKGSFKGPPGTPYEGGQYVVDIKIPNEYPFKPPIMRFDTKVWHPNVSSQTGAICLDTLSAAWSPVLTIKSALLSLQSLLSTPEPKDPQDAEVAGMLLRNPRLFEKTAKDWAVRFAGAPLPMQDNFGAGGGGGLHQRQQQQRGNGGNANEWGEPFDHDMLQFDHSSGGGHAFGRVGSREEAMRRRAEEERLRQEQYEGYSSHIFDSFIGMGFDVPRVVRILKAMSIPRGVARIPPDVAEEVVERLLSQPM